MRYTNAARADSMTYPFAFRRMGNVDAYETVFLLSYGVWLIAMLLLSSFFAALFGTYALTAARYAGLFGAALSIFMRRNYVAAEVFAAFLAVVLLFISTRTNAPSLLDLLIFVYCGRFVDFKKIARESLWIMSLLLLVVVSSALAGLINNYISVTWDGSIIRRREYLGFLYALQPAQLMFNITLLAIFLKGERFSTSLAVALLVANLFIYFKADARLSTTISVAAIFVALLLRNGILKRSLGRFLLFAAPVAFIACFAICWVLTAGYSANSAFFHDLNFILGDRLRLAQNGLDMYGTTLFGQTIDFIGGGLGLDGKVNSSGNYNYIDCLYVRLPILYGWVFTALFLIGMSAAGLWAARKRDCRLALILTAIALHCVVDDLVIRLQFCTFLFLIADSLVDLTKDRLATRKTKQAFREKRTSFD